jgi:hypothetical protein
MLVGIRSNNSRMIYIEKRLEHYQRSLGALATSFTAFVVVRRLPPQLPRACGVGD